MASRVPGCVRGQALQRGVVEAVRAVACRRGREGGRGGRAESVVFMARISGKILTMGTPQTITRRGCAVRVSEGFQAACASLPPPENPAYNPRTAATLRGLARPARRPPALKNSDFHYDLPPELIAQAPLPERSASRLLVVPPAPAPFAGPRRPRPAGPAARRRPAGVQRHPRDPGAPVRRRRPAAAASKS